MSTSQQLDLTFAALADPTRRAILAKLSEGEASVTDLVKPFHLSQPAISKHLKVLERAGLVSRTREQNFRPCRLSAAPMKSAVEWLMDYRRFWEASLDRLEVYAKQMQVNERQQKRKDGKHGPHRKR